MVDEYLWGDVNRISPEAPVPVVFCTNRESRMGGAANVAINIKSLGAEPVMCTVIGRDEIGAVFKSLMDKRHMVTDGIVEDESRITTVKTRVIGNHQHLIRVDQEDTDFISPLIEQMLFRKIETIIRSSTIDAIIFQDYDKGVLTKGIIEKVIELAKEKFIPTLVDPKKRSFTSYHGVTLFKPNFKELVEGLNVSIKKGDHEAMFNAVSIMHHEWGVENVMVTLSEKGVFVSNGESFTAYPAEIRDITDVSGAGDTVVSVAALGLASGLTAAQCAYLANMAGGLVCEKVGVVPITPQQIIEEEIELPNE